MTLPAGGWKDESFGLPFNAHPGYNCFVIGGLTQLLKNVPSYAAYLRPSREQSALIVQGMAR